VKDSCDILQNEPSLRSVASEKYNKD